MDTVAVIPSRGRRHCLVRAVASLEGQTTAVVVVDNNDDPEPLPGTVTVHRRMQPPNLSLLLNEGIDAAELLAKTEHWNLVLMNDDAEVYYGWVENLVYQMRAHDAAAAFISRHPLGAPRLMTSPPESNEWIITGWACVVRGELGLRWDEDLQWWYGDNDYDLRLRQAGGVLAVPGVLPQHHHPSEQTFASTELSVQAREDERTFNRKWAGKAWA